MTPHAFRLACLLLTVPFLNACLQIELYGPVASATVSVHPLRGGSAVVQGLRSDSVSDTAARWGEEKWASFQPTVQLWLLGGANIPAGNLDDNTLYLVTASGGRDQDYDENRIPNRIGARILGDWHAVATGAQLKLPVMRVSVLTEAVYQTLLPDLDELSNFEVARRLDELAQSVVGDINNDGNNDYLDVLSWSTMLNEAQYKGSERFLERMRHDVEWNSDALTRRDNGINLVTRASWKPALSDSAYGEILVPCATPVLVRDLCKLHELPILGSVTAPPTVADVMQRVVVSHDWMANRFEQLLREMPAELLLLTRSLTGVVIGARVRPSYYSPVNSMMYLDAENFWLTDAERQTVSTEEDYRAEFARQFEFADAWRYVRGSDSAFADLTDVDAAGNRALAQIVPPAASLLFHELAHANDHVPSAVYSTLNPFQTLYDQFFERPSDVLNTELPLQSAQLLNLATALYAGSPATSQEKLYSADFIGQLFEPDGASDLYAYSSQFEDLAMLFEEFMMRRHYSLQRDIAFTAAPEDESGENFCDELLVRWGVRGRIGADHLRPRLEQVLADLLPGQNFSTELALLPTPVAMKKGRDWCENLSLDAGAAAPRPAPAALRKPAPAPDLRPRPYL